MKTSENKSIIHETAQPPIHRERLPISSHTPWRLVLSAAMSVLLVIVLFQNRAWLGEALSLVRTTDLRWLGSAFGVILLSYLISSQVFQIVLRSLGHRLGVVRVWFTAVTAIVISQSIPAGGVGSYAFLMSAFRRRGVPATQAALLATLEALSYVGAMLLFAAFSIVYLIARPAGTGGGSSLTAPLVGGAVALVVLALVGVTITQPAARLEAWALAILRCLPRPLRRDGAEAQAAGLVAELVQSRQVVTARPRMLATLVVVQLVALSGHSLALLLVLQSLGVHTSFAVVATAFGIALITSTFNVLPGGGGTVEAALVAVLLQLSVGAAAVPAAILFRLLNFWTLLPVAAGGYGWLIGWRRPDPA